MTHLMPRTSDIPLRPDACTAIVQAFQPSRGSAAGPNKFILRLMYAMADRNDTMVAELRSHHVPERLLAWLLSVAEHEDEDEDEPESVETALQVRTIQGRSKVARGPLPSPSPPRSLTVVSRAPPLHPSSSQCWYQDL